MSGLKEFQSNLQEHNIKATIVDSGKLELIEQFELFASCDKIIGLRGSDFSNICWLNKNKAIILDNGPKFSPIRNLSSILGLDSKEIRSEQKTHINILEYQAQIMEIVNVKSKFIFRTKILS